MSDLSKEQIVTVATIMHIASEVVNNTCKVPEDKQDQVDQIVANGVLKHIPRRGN